MALALLGRAPCRPRGHLRGSLRTTPALPAPPLHVLRPGSGKFSLVAALRALAESDDADLASVADDSFESSDSYDEKVLAEEEEALSLTVSSPALLLNHMAERYTSTSRILMEFVDNGFDDGEALFQRDEIGGDALVSSEHTSFVSGGYSRPLHIDVVVNKDLREVRVVDNSRGMPRDVRPYHSCAVLQRVVLRVGESRKRGMAFLNGQFGFGMQAFRAACEGLRVRSRHESSPSILEISVNRSESGGFRVVSIPGEACEALPATGTEVTLSGFDEQWLENGFDPEDIAAEIECHFERLLSRQGLRVRVLTEDKSREVVHTHVCRPFDYADPSLGVFATVQKQFVWPEPLSPAGGKKGGAADAGKGSSKKAPARETKPQAFDVCLSVVGRPMDDRYRARIFVNGRRIKEVHALSSFSAVTDHRWDLWGHAQVVGYIDVAGGEGAGALQPVITRDEFKRTRSRKKCYEQVVDVCEPDLLAALEGVQQAQSDSSMGQLESVITACLAGVSREEYPSASRRPRKAKPKPDTPQAAIEAAVEATGVGAILRKLTGQPEPEPGTAASDSSVEAFREAEEREREESAERAQGGGEKGGGTTRVSASSALDFEVRMVRGLPDGGEGDRRGGSKPRSMLVGNTIMVDTEHPDFKARLKTTRGGRERFDERLCGYLSTIVSAHYRDRAYLQRGEVPESREQVYEDMINTYVRLEERLRRNLPALMAQMAKADGAAGDDPSLALLRRRARDRT